MISRRIRAALSSLAGLLLLSAALPDAIAVAHAASGAEHARSTSREAQALLQKAEKYLAANGPEKAFAAFNNRNGPFVHKDLYVFVIDQQGVYQANGAAPATLVGLNVLETKDAAGNPLFRNMLDAVKTQEDGQVRYVWLDRATNKVEPKVT
ncbi:MAG: cache domain-containing protein, partial [Betaproteobacteria bacterium]|nr:cache domain-containing protein [Betaproteobacteria bacterium]